MTRKIIRYRSNLPIVTKELNHVLCQLLIGESDLEVVRGKANAILESKDPENQDKKDMLKYLLKHGDFYAQRVF